MLKHGDFSKKCPIESNKDLPRFTLAPKRKKRILSKPFLNVSAKRGDSFRVSPRTTYILDQRARTPYMQSNGYKTPPYCPGGIVRPSGVSGEARFGGNIAWQTCTGRPKDEARPWSILPRGIHEGVSCRLNDRRTATYRIRTAKPPVSDHTIAEERMKSRLWNVDQPNTEHVEPAYGSTQQEQRRKTGAPEPSGSLAKKKLKSQLWQRNEPTS